jgi:hypothetical protein
VTSPSSAVYPLLVWHTISVLKSETQHLDMREHTRQGIRDSLHRAKALPLAVGSGTPSNGRAFKVGRIDVATPH